MDEKRDGAGRYLGWRDVAELFGCKRSKALRIIHSLGPAYVGRSPCVTMGQIERALAESGEIKTDWGRRQPR